MGKNRKFNNGSSPWDYVGNIASLAGTGMSIGGPVGAGVGALAGVGMSIMQANQLKESERIKKNQANAASTMNMSNFIKANYDMQNNSNTGVPGFKDGLSKFMPQLPGIPNAYVSKGEVIKNPIDGSLDRVPGEYNGSNVDTVMTNLMPASSVFSANPDNKLPFGKSTPAEIAARMEKAQKSANEKLAGKGSRLDKETAGLNKLNIEKQLANLDKLTYIQNAYKDPMSMMPGFYNGHSSFADNDYMSEADENGIIQNRISPLTDNIGVERARIQFSPSAANIGIDRIMPKGIHKDSFDYSPDPAKFKLSYDKIGSLLSTAASLAPVISNLTSKPEVTQPIFSSYMNPMMSYNMAPEMSDMASQSRVARYSAGNLGGAGMSYGANVYGKSLAGKANLSNTAQKFNSDQVGQYANRYNQSAQEVSAERRRIQDINMRNDAANRSIRNAGLTQLSQFIQNKELMNNQMSNDELNALIFSSYASDMDPEVKDQIMKLIKSRLKRR